MTFRQVVSHSQITEPFHDQEKTIFYQVSRRVIKQHILYLTCLFVPSRSKWHRSWKTHTQSRWQDCTLNTRPNVTCWKTWGMNTSVHRMRVLTQSWRTHSLNQLPDDFKSSRHVTVICTACTHAQEERRKETTNEWGRSGMRRRERRRRSIVIFLRRTKGRENDEGISCCPLPALQLLLFQILFSISLCHLFHVFFLSVPVALTIFLSPYLSFSFWLSSVYSWRVWFWQFSLLDLAMGGNPGSFTRSHFLCWLSIDYLWQQTL